MTIQQQIDALKKEFANKIAELEKQAKVEEKQSKVWKPKRGETYYCAHTDGYVGLCRCDDDEVDKARLTMGSCFKTKKEAEWTIQHRIVAFELECFVKENDPRPITEEDWEDTDASVEKWYLYYNYNKNVVTVGVHAIWKSANQVYASNEEVLQKAIEHIGEERLKKYYFGVGK